jgi:hypothetical protein
MPQRPQGFTLAWPEGCGTLRRKAAETKIRAAAPGAAGSGPFPEAGTPAADEMQEFPRLAASRKPGRRRPPSPKSRIELLEEENALLALELAQTQARLEQAEQEQAALLLELVNREVI